jgi:hypothetical protein
VLLAKHPAHRHLANAATLAQADAQVAAADWIPAFLDSHQNETLIALAERIVSGSTRAQVNRFVDLLVSVDNQDTQQRFLNSLSAFEAESLHRFSTPFARLAESRQLEILAAAASMEPGQKAAEQPWGWFGTSGAEEPSQPERLTLRDHLENLKAWISGAYYSSEIGMNELGWTGNSFFESFPGCQHPEGHH